jgi:glycosyltransferase involved in cell wall biosynthesis
MHHDTKQKSSELRPTVELSRAPDEFSGPSRIWENRSGGDGLPEVSVLVPAYNHEAYVAECIESIASQSIASRIELVVINDGSTDRTLVEAERALNASSLRWVLVDQPNQGICAGLNRALELAEGEFVCVIASDDSMLPDRVERQAEELRARPELAAVFGDVVEMDVNGRPRRTVSYQPARGLERLYVDFLLRRSVVGLQSMMIRKDVARELGFDPTLPYEDVDFVARLLRCQPVDYVPGPVMRYRFTGTGLGSKARFMAEAAAEIALKHADDPRVIAEVGRPTGRILRALAHRRAAALHLLYGDVRRGAQEGVKSVVAWPLARGGWKELVAAGLHVGRLARHGQSQGEGV